MTERRIRNAVGRPVNRVILDQNDDVILDTGEIITYGAVEAARQSGVLDILLASVYTERPRLDLGDLRLTGSGGNGDGGGYASLGSQTPRPSARVSTYTPSTAAETEGEGTSTVTTRNSEGHRRNATSAKSGRTASAAGETLELPQVSRTSGRAAGEETTDTK
jgi:hypothetical protein